MQASLTFQSKFEESLKELDLQAIILIQGLLAQRALEILMKDKEPKKEILVPKNKIIA